jgi:hypothetical protein
MCNAAVVAWLYIRVLCSWQASRGAGAGDADHLALQFAHLKLVLCCAAHVVLCRVWQEHIDGAADDAITLLCSLLTRHPSGLILLMCCAAQGVARAR